MTTDCPDNLSVTTGAAQGATVLTAHGSLNGTTYRKLRDAIITAAIEEPVAVIVDVADLIVPAESAWVVFTSARWHVNRWPEVPIVVVSPDIAMRDAMTRNGVTRYVPVHESVREAVGASSADRYRRRARAELPPGPVGLIRARDLVSEWLTTWSQTDLIPVAKVVVTSFVENVLEHTDGLPGMRVETNGQTVTVAVADHDTAPAVLREAHTATDLHSGLRIVSALCRSWGNVPTPDGKIVWAVMGPENRL